MPFPRAFFFSLWLLTLVSGCGRFHDPAELTFVNGVEPESLDPGIVTGQPEGRLCFALFEGLTSHDAHGQVIPGIAENWDLSPDGRTYTFHLRESSWNNGDPFTAYDFEKSWERALNPKLASKYAEMFFFIVNAEAYNSGTITDFSQVGAKALDARTFQVTLLQPTPFFPHVCAFVTLLPVHVPSIQRWGDQWIKPGKLVSNGAYELEAWRLDDRVRLRANPHYWAKDKVHLKKIDALSLNQATTAYNLFYSGKADLLLDKGSVPVQFMDELRTKPYFHPNPFLANYFYRFNVTRKPLNDVRVRQALAMAIDKKRIVQKITKAGESIAGSFVPPGLTGYEPPTGVPYDPVKARELLAAAGFPGGKNFPLLSILYNSSDLNQQIAVEIQAMWKEELGIVLTLRNQEWKVYLGTLDKLDYDIARSSWVGDYPDPLTFLDCFVTGRGNNRTGWSNSSYDRLLQQSRETVDPAQRLAQLKAAETILVEKELPLMPVYYFVGLTLYDADKIGGFYPNLIDEHPLRELYLKEKP